MLTDLESIWAPSLILLFPDYVVIGKCLSISDAQRAETIIVRTPSSERWQNLADHGLLKILM